MKKHLNRIGILIPFLFLAACGNSLDYEEGTSTFDVEIIELYSDPNSNLDNGKVYARPIGEGTSAEGNLIFNASDLPDIGVEAGDTVTLTISTPYLAPESASLEIIDWELVE